MNTPTLTREMLLKEIVKPPLSLFKVERLNADYSQERLASHLSVSKSAIVRTEQGLYVTPNEKYVQFLVDTRGYSPRKLLDVYRSFQTRTRLYHGRQGVAPYLHNSRRLDQKLQDATIHPLDEICYDSDTGKIRSVASFIKAFCLPYSEVQRWRTYPYNVRTIPVSVIEALKEAGFSDTDLNDLKEYYRKYRLVSGFDSDE